MKLLILHWDNTESGFILYMICLIIIYQNISASEHLKKIDINTHPYNQMPCQINQTRASVTTPKFCLDVPLLSRKPPLLSLINFYLNYLDFPGYL